MSEKLSFMAWHGSVDTRRRLADHADYHIRTRALASLRQLGHGDMTHDEYMQLHDNHLAKTMGHEHSLSNLYSALVDSRLKPKHLEIAVNRVYTSQMGKIFQREARKKLDKLVGENNER